ncbi:MAG: peptide chain release factor 1 [Candidatus Schekmanbacteria bacterium RIFCSPHIGHO2_02_FULL_38_11]|uniref:Peptide chain release factor 1 n=1 Tax=Candidatus Schekmanbacteria bacterium RIFCSPLOWO2_12_FULL_38_15 TaxID=1817883 RepID=A0A1F7SH42_9BACT|nr:MAG: peptide chain release factor 1 [Candidatus Schekmanbacteria bacterium GWA2_38_9]OGL48574.1 MAG: peptide chain release factor 1 [Candidatus Schekmanbacteria bacterium RIFCSPLOWO2_02_FULL_38_14]OGL52554.1 MAG: peptide chain release factor 1 [Candidatus Schekmanbacteria bacterium RIFCSPLOWO2_12_FULL_38_15]OGL53263.1 MAG: peptide chain release factor 1 [Candidatus Schekmanbacteria bacterium RIFCSPHIGHO2_02_FULL_38_11]
MFEKLEWSEKRFEELAMLMSDPKTLGNPAEFSKYAKEHSELSKIIEIYRQYKKATKELGENKTILSDEKDEELKELAKDEIERLNSAIVEIEKNLKLLLLPMDPNDEKNILVEIRAGAGGEEAALFASELFRMYSRYAEGKKWKVEVMSSSLTGIGGVKEVIALIEGKNVYSQLKYESGVHRVQRIPSTEGGGRIHTSTVTVAVLPEAEEVDIQINPDEVKVDVFRSSGPGGQSVNTTDSAVRVTHIPTGMVVTCQDEKSQHKNKAKAMKILRARLLDRMRKEQQAERSQQRKSQVGTGDRSEKIRTYNFPQDRITDHRIGLTLHNLDKILDGEIDGIIDELITYYQTQALKESFVGENENAQ